MLQRGQLICRRFIAFGLLGHTLDSDFVIGSALPPAADR
jgi:hypothetical protein